VDIGNFSFVRYEDFTAVTLKNAVSLDMTLCNVLQLLVTANVFPGSLFSVTLMMMKAISSFETSDFTRATLRRMPGYGILHGLRRENFKSYIALTGWAV
jgi:hypothetical protein